MTFSHTQIAQFVRCPRSYRYRYLEGWREKETRAAMVFGRCRREPHHALLCMPSSNPSPCRDFGGALVRQKVRETMPDDRAKARLRV